MLLSAPRFDPSTVDTTVIDRLSKVVIGNPNLVTAPGLVGPLASGNATRRQAQVINQYIGAVRMAAPVNDPSASSHDSAGLRLGEIPINRLREILGSLGTAPSDEELKMKWLVENYIHPELTTVTGQPETGKTTLLLALIKGVVGGHFAGAATYFPSGRRIVVGCESKDAVSRMREIFSDDLAGTVVPFLLNSGPPLDGLASVVKELECGWLIIDSVMPLVGTTNDQEAARGLLNAIRNVHIPVTTVHHSAKAQNRGPGGAQAYAAAYRHTVDVHKMGTGRNTIDVRVNLSGNNVEQSQAQLRINRDTFEVQILDTVSPARRSRNKPSSVQGEALGAYAKAQGLPAQTNDNAWATALLGGPRGKENPELKAAVAATTGVRLGHRALAGYISREAVAFDRGYGLSRTIAA